MRCFEFLPLGPHHGASYFSHGGDIRSARLQTAPQNSGSSVVECCSGGCDRRDTSAYLQDHTDSTGRDKIHQARNLLSRSHRKTELHSLSNGVFAGCSLEVLPNFGSLYDSLVLQGLFARFTLIFQSAHAKPLGCRPLLQERERRPDVHADGLR